jgi:hypothetical protein
MRRILLLLLCFGLVVAITTRHVIDTASVKLTANYSTPSRTHPAPGPDGAAFTAVLIYVKAANDNAWYTELARQETVRQEAVRRTAAKKSFLSSGSTGTTTPVVTSGDAESAIRHWFPDMYDKAVRVADCESSLNPGSVSSGGGNWGLFQINSVHRDSFTSVTGQPWSAVLNADANAQFARWLFNSSGWGPWACRGA